MGGPSASSASSSLSLAIGAQSNYVLEHILRPSIHPHLKQQMFGFGRTAVEGDANSARQQCEPLRSFSLRQ
jgi:hypothetical protein